MEQQLSFNSFNLNPTILAAVAKAGYETPTPIQQQAIPHVLEGRDLLGLAQTGTGKTAAFALPILHTLMPGARGKVRALVIVPTRELAEQVHRSFCSLCFGSKLRSTAIYGGVSFGMQVREITRGAEIVVACPGRLLDHVARKTIDLSAVEIVVLDEADHMFDMGFLPFVRKILAALPTKRQNLLFSATMPPELRGLAMETLKDPVTVEIRPGDAATTVKHAFYETRNDGKNQVLLAVLNSMSAESVLIFTRTKHRARKLATELESHGHSVTSLQGNLSQAQRARAMQGFRSGKYQIMVATDIAARGIDISTVSHVVNFDPPDTVEAYVHRIGRTGRAARTGDAFTLITSSDTLIVRAIERRLKMQIERRRIEGEQSVVTKEAVLNPSGQRHASEQPQDELSTAQSGYRRNSGRGSRQSQRGAARGGPRNTRSESSFGSRRYGNSETAYAQGAPRGRFGGTRSRSEHRSRNEESPRSRPEGRSEERPYRRHDTAPGNRHTTGSERYSARGERPYTRGERSSVRGEGHRPESGRYAARGERYSARGDRQPSRSERRSHGSEGHRTGADQRSARPTQRGGNFRRKSYENRSPKRW